MKKILIDIFIYVLNFIDPFNWLFFMNYIYICIYFNMYFPICLFGGLLHKNMYLFHIHIYLCIYFILIKMAFLESILPLTLNNFYNVSCVIVCIT